MIEGAETNHHLLRKSIDRYQRQRNRRPAQPPKEHHLPPLHKPLDKRLHESHPEAPHRGCGRATERQRGHAVMRAVNDYDTNETTRAPSPISSRGGNTTTRNRRGHGSKKGQPASDAAVPQEWFKNLDKWMEAVDAPELPESLPDPEEERPAEEKTTSRRRQHMGGGRNRNPTKKLPVAKPAAPSDGPGGYPAGPDPAMLAAMRNQCARPDGAADSRPPAYGM